MVNFLIGYLVGLGFGLIVITIFSINKEEE